MSKIFGYIISLIGVLVLIASLKPIRASLPFLANIPDVALWGIGLIIIIVGVFTLKKSKGGFGGGKQAAEVPIYHGKNVVGFRRLGK